MSFKKLIESKFLELESNWHLFQIFNIDVANFLSKENFSSYTFLIEVGGGILVAS